MPDLYHSALKRHAERMLGNCNGVLVWDAEYQDRRGINVKCLEFAPNSEFRFWTYVSAGLGLVNETPSPYSEFVLCSPFQTLEHSELFTMIGGFSRDRDRRFDVGNVLEIGRPWIVGSSMEHVLVSVPYPFGPALENADVVRPGLKINWMLPIHVSEINFLKKTGLEPLEKAFDEQAIDFLDINRPAVV